MSISVIIVEDNVNYREITKGFLTRNNISVLADYTHTEFIDKKPIITVDVVLISFRASLTFTKYTIDFIKVYYKKAKIALLVSAYDSASPKELETLSVDGAIRKAAADPFELLIMLEVIMRGGKYLNLRVNQPGT